MENFYLQLGREKQALTPLIFKRKDESQFLLLNDPRLEKIIFPLWQYLNFKNRFWYFCTYSWPEIRNSLSSPATKAQEKKRGAP